jgi:multisubunit Na+/H+ antiporter MnhB subunit
MSTLASLGRPESKFQTLISTPTAVLIGVVGAIITVKGAGLPGIGLTLGCIGVAMLYSVYPLFSLAWGNGQERLIEWAFLAVGVTSIALAVSFDPRWLALGWAAHGTWDALHHRDHHVIGLRGIPLWYIQTCLVWDVPAALGLLIFL